MQQVLVFEEENKETIQSLFSEENNVEKKLRTFCSQL
jgi:hypothetical protein